MNCSGGTVVSDGFNLVDDETCGLDQASDHPNEEPVLGALADNGGATPTMALGAGSPATDAGTALDSVDQRGLTRPVDLAAVPNDAGSDGSDIGAFEIQAPVDADGDGIVDSADTCPTIMGPGPSGCPTIAGSLSHNYLKRKLEHAGRLKAGGTSGCEEGREVTVFKQKRGPDKTVGSDATDAEGKYSVERRAKRGRYYATADEETVPLAGICVAVKSPKTRVR